MAVWYLQSRMGAEKRVHPIWWLIIYHFRYEQLPYIGDNSVNQNPYGSSHILWEFGL